ncbi:MAG TPA: family 43 glycosylhydrolase [Candidatus Deferrimicrobium sp.]|nr:family 43 glycosylhydrolase [Candidatus Deferrimicrobium sp.]
MKVEQFKTWNKWVDHPDNPLIRPETHELQLADPTFLPPSDTPDGKWHLFAHGILHGIYHYISKDGIKWLNTHKNIPSGLRPFLFKEDDTYYLLYEKIFTLLLSNIVICQSSDLFDWSPPKIILTTDHKWEGLSNRRIGNPCILKPKNKYYLFYSAGDTFLWECLFSEPRFIGLAVSDSIGGPYHKLARPIIRPLKKHKYRNLGAGAIKVIRVGDSWIGFNNGIYKDKYGRSRSSILLLHSDDGITWTDIFDRPILYPTSGWKSAFVYQLDVRKIGHQYWLYYNARSGWSLGTEAIGLAILNLK